MAALRQPPSLPPSDASGGGPTYHIEHVDGAGTLSLSEAVLSRLRDQELDVIVALGFEGLRGEVLTDARFGVWSLRRGDPASYRGGPPYLWELAERNPISGVALELLANEPLEARILCQGFARTHSGASARQNGVRPLLLGTSLVIRKLEQLRHQGFDSVIRGSVPAAPYLGRRPRYGPPNNREMIRFAAPMLLRTVSRRVLRALGRKPAVEQWRVAIRVGSGASPVGDHPDSFDGFRWIEAPPGRFYADPCLIARGGEIYCYVEDYDHVRGQGRISCGVVDREGGLSNVRPVLELPHHLSYPFVFQHGGLVYMVPEGAQGGSVDLYRAVRFPDRWERVRTLLAVPGLDTTVLHHDGLFWFFVTVREPKGAGEQLLLYHSASLAEPLEPHPCNPISADVRYCRSGGPVAGEAGRLVRTSQDCSVTYGYQLHFHRILELSTERYREERVGTLAPPPGLAGVHTYCRCGAVEVIDGKRFEAAWKHVARRR